MVLHEGQRCLNPRWYLLKTLQPEAVITVGENDE